MYYAHIPADTDWAMNAMAIPETQEKLVMLVLWNSNKKKFLVANCHSKSSSMILSDLHIPLYKPIKALFNLNAFIIIWKVFFS